MEYIVKETFRDRHLKQVFKAGDTYPAERAPEGWVDVLLSNDNQCGRPFLTEKKTDDPEREALLLEAASLGLTVHPNTGVAKLKEKIEEAKSASQNSNQDGNDDAGADSADPQS